MRMTADAIVFDLDGTLLDTLDDIADSANRALEREGFPTHPRGDFRRFIGDGVQMLVKRALPPESGDPATIDRVVEAYRVEYAAGWDRETHPYPGVEDLLDALVARGLKLAVLSNKPDEFTQLCVGHYLGRWPFECVLGHRPEWPRKPSPESARHVAAGLGVSPDRCAFVGDSVADVLTAKAAGMRPVAVSWGFQDAEILAGAGAEVVIDRPSDLLEFLDGRGAKEPRG
ncbi:MAG: HAD-IA family hydrolase [Isosphaeraceae bacterium]